MVCRHGIVTKREKLFARTHTHRTKSTGWIALIGSNNMDEWISFAFEQMRLCSLSLCYSHSSERYIQMHKYINCTCINKPNVESSVKSFRWKSDLIWKSYRDNMPLNINGITSQRHHIVVIMGGWAAECDADSVECACRTKSIGDGMGLSCWWVHGSIEPKCNSIRSAEMCRTNWMLDCISSVFQWASN